MNNNLISDVIQKLKNSNYSLSSVESFTGGLFSSTVTSFSGVSAFYKGGFVTYTNKMKEMIGVNPITLDKYTAVSEQTCKEMALCGHNKTSSDICVSFTGNAGPNPSEGRPVGLIYIGVYFNGEVIVKEFQFSSNMTRNEIRDFAIDESFLLIDKILFERK